MSLKETKTTEGSYFSYICLYCGAKAPVEESVEDANTAASINNKPITDDYIIQIAGTTLKNIAGTAKDEEIQLKACGLLMDLANLMNVLKPKAYTLDDRWKND